MSIKKDESRTPQFQALDNPKDRQKVFKAFCAWLASGKMKKSFYYEDDKISVSWQPIRRYMKLFPEDMPPEPLEIAKAKGIGYWEEEVAKAAVGKNRHANPACLQMILRNKCGWDKPGVCVDDDEDDNKKVDPFVEVKDFFRDLRGALPLPCASHTAKQDDHE